MGHLAGCSTSYVAIKSTNPDPHNYKVLEASVVRDLLIVKVNYPDCTNYEGNKILVFDNVKLEDFINTKSLDPHFNKSSIGVHPIARFQPDENGMKMAEVFCIAWYVEKNPQESFR